MSPVKQNVTIGDVAHRLGIAKGTVSRALNDYPDISPETRLRVLAAVKELGYRPSSLARRLKRGRVETVGIVLPIANAHISDAFLSEFLDGLSQGLGRQDHDLLVATAPDAAGTLAVYERLLAASKVDGMIVTRTLTNDPRIDYLRQHGVPFVAHGRTKDPSGYAWFDIDNEAALEMAANHIIGLGHRRIAYIGAPSEMNFARLRLSGFKRGLEGQGLDVDPELITETTLDETAGYETAKSLLKLAAPPTAIVAAVDVIAAGAVKAAREMGLSVGSDVTIIGYDGAPLGRYLEPPLTTISQSVAEAGAAVAGMMLALIDGSPAHQHQRFGDVTLLRRASDGPPRLTSAELGKKIAKRVI
ncbi:MAG: LacI family DNA-binding transcriptional regulator [Stappiaceae bacterium]